VSGEMRPAIGDFPAGSQIASYQIEELIGRGGMAVVYRAVDVRLGRLVALKILAPELARDDAFRQRFIRESRSGAAVDHPNVIPVFEAGEADGVLFIAMRYVTGQDVRALIEQHGQLPTARTVSIVTQVASALDAAHAHGLIHRDVKPANMLLATATDGRTPDHIYLSDFGLSKQSVSTSSLTGTGQFLGTLDYMSPEQVEGRPIDGRTDLYALACAAFEMLTGQPPFRREQNLAVMWAQVSAAPPSVRQWRPELPPAVDQVIAKALAKSPADRHASCLEFAAELRAACAAGPGPSAEQPGGYPAAGPAGPATELAAGPLLPGGPGQPAGPGQPRMPAGPGQAAAAGQEVTITELAPEGGLRAIGLHPGAAAAGPPGPAGSSYQPTSGYQAGSAPPGYQGGGPGYQSGGPGGYQGGGGPGYQSGGPSGPPGLTNPLLPGGAGYPPAGPPRRRRKGLPIFLGCLLVLALAAAAFVVLHLGNGLLSSHSTPSQTTTTVTISPTGSPSQSASQSPSPSGSPQQSSSPAASPSEVVTAYFNAINNHQYQTAWNIDQYEHSVMTYTMFRNGFAGTQYDQWTIVSVSGDVVTIQLAAHQTDGTVKNYSGSYTVQNGAITGSNIQQG